MPGVVMADDKLEILDAYKRDAAEVLSVDFDFKKWRALSEHGLEGEDEDTHKDFFDYCVELHNAFVELFGDEVRDFYDNLVNDEEKTPRKKKGNGAEKDLQKILEATLKSCFHAFADNSEDMENYGKAIACIKECRFTVAYETESPLPDIDLENAKVGDVIECKEDVVGKPVFLKHRSGNKVLPIFTGDLVLDARADGLIDFDILMDLHFSDIFERAKKYDIGAIVINPFTDNIPIPNGLFDKIEEVPPIFGGSGEGYRVDLSPRKKGGKKTAKQGKGHDAKPRLQVFNMDFEGADPFKGESIGGFGTMWKSIFSEDDDIVAHIPQMLNEGKNTATVQDGDVIKVAFLEYPEKSSLRGGILCVGNPESGDLEVGSGYPVMEGLPNKMKYCGQKHWKNKLEGDIFARQENDGPSVSFFNPYYFNDGHRYRKNSKLTVSLAALAFSCEEAKDKEVVLEKGNGLYDEQLEEFLSENPGKTESDFEAPVIHLSGSRFLIPKDYLSLYEFRCPVIEAHKLEFCGKPIWKLGVIFAGWDEQEIIGYLYVPEALLDGFKPKKGDDIQGVLWMTGIIE